MNDIFGAALRRPGFGCRLHGEHCKVPWGYDEAHTDQRHPYTLDQLAARSNGPHRYAYPTSEAYVQGWHLWRAIQRDNRPIEAEAAAAEARRLRMRQIVDQAAMELGYDPDELAAAWGIEWRP